MTKMAVIVFLILWRPMCSGKAYYRGEGNLAVKGITPWSGSMTERIKIYALSTCPYCKRTKRFLDEHGVEYDLVDVDLADDEKQDALLQEIDELTGRRSFPVVIIGSDVIVGHDEERLRKALKL